MKKFMNKKLIIPVLIVIVLVIWALTAYTGGVPAELTRVEKGQVVKLIKESGTVESQNAITITAKNGGQLENVFVEEGQPVKQGDMLIKWKATGTQLDIKSMQSELTGLQVQYNLAREIADKNKLLYEQGALSYEEYNQSAAAAKQLTAQIDALNYSIKSYGTAASPSDVTAAMDGVVTAVYVKKGEYVAPGSPLFELSDLSSLYVKTDLIAADADQIKVGDVVNVYRDDTGYFDDRCTVKKIHIKAEDKVSELGISQKRVTVEIALGSKPAPGLGRDVDVQIIADKRDDVIFVANTAIFEQDKKDCVYVVHDGKAVRTEVKTGLKGEDNTEIVSGLSEGEWVVLSPDSAIEEGIKIKQQGKEN